jgi:hypothetical protein
VEQDPGRHLAVTRAFQKMWVAGTVGAFFSSIGRALPVNLHWFWEHLGWDAAGDLLLRYAYLLWLLGYFLISSVGLDRPQYTPSRKDIGYDVVQSVAALAAAYFLGFLQLDTSYGWIKFAFANLAILVICGLSLKWFREKATEGVNALRWYGVAISLTALLVPLIPQPEWVRRCVFGVTLVLLVWVLVMYIRIRWDKDEYPSGAIRSTVV